MKLELHDQEVQTVFGLKGCDENALTCALGWVLAKNKQFLKTLTRRVTGLDYACENEKSKVRLQTFSQGQEGWGFTDIELLIDNDLFVIIEAKISQNLPEPSQLNKYANRFGKDEFKSYSNKKLLVISECRKEYAIPLLRVPEVEAPPEYLSWQEIRSMIDKIYSGCNRYEKKMLDDFDVHLRNVVTMEAKGTNKVLCVSLNRETDEGMEISNLDIILKKRMYYYPVGNYWPAVPPHYIAFRYDGKLQSIHYVDHYRITRQMYKYLPCDREDWQFPFFLLNLGEPFRPEHEVYNGDKNMRARHVEFDLDTVFTCKTIKEAVDLTKKREKTTRESEPLK